MQSRKSLGLKKKMRSHRISLAHVPGLIFLFFFVASASLSRGGDLFFTLFDDAMINMTYARTLAETGVFNWFAGAETVQGFTTPLWALYMAWIHALGFTGSSAALVVTVTSAGIIVAISLQVRALVLLALDSQSGSTKIADFATGSTYFLYPLIFWSLRGFEVGILSLLLLVLVHQIMKISKDPPRSHKLTYSKIALVVFLGVGVRLDFLVPVSGILIVIFFHTLMRSKPISLLAVVGASMALSAAAVFAFQYFVWGEFLPNTYYLKLDSFSLGDRITRGFVSSLKLVPLLVIAVFVWSTLRKSSNLITHIRGAVLISDYLAASTLMLFLYQIYTGGDAWESLGFASRYFSVALPAVLVLSAVLSHSAWGQVDKVRIKYLIFVLLSFILSGFGVNPISFSLSSPLVLMFGFASLTAVFLLANSSGGKHTNLRKLIVLGIASLIFTVSLYIPYPDRLLALAGATGLFIYFFMITLRSQADSGQYPNQKSVGLIISLLIVGSLSPAVDFWYHKAPQYSTDDAKMSRFGLEIRGFTSEDAIVAVLWAGAPVYYSDRAAIDLLGKSDRAIARGETPPIPPGFWNSDFYPGHNKYDFRYSVGALKPDVVAQHFDYPGERRSLATWGYSPFCTNGGEQVFIRDDSRKVNRSLLLDCGK